MSDFLKCDCPYCGQSIEYPAEGTGETVPCPTCQKPFTLTPTKLTSLPEKQGSVSKWSNLFRERNRSQEPMIPDTTREKPATMPPENLSTEFGSTEIQATAPATTQTPKEKRTVRANLLKLTEETIRARTKAGDTPLHRAAKNGQFHLIPSHLLNIDLFKIQNNGGQTCLHVAAKYGTLYQVPRQFLTIETLTIPAGTWVTGSGYTAHGDTVLHVAAHNGHADQIPKEFLTPEYLLIEATGYRLTVLQFMVEKNQLDVLPAGYANSGLWNLRGVTGLTPLEILEDLISREAQMKVWRAESDRRERERAVWRPPPFTGPTQTDPMKLLPIFTDESLRQIRIMASTSSDVYTVNLLEYTCTCPLCMEIHSGVPARDFGRLCKHIILALRRYNLVRNLPPIARAIAENGSPDAAFGVYPGRFASDLNGNLIYITGRNYDGWINVFALYRRRGVNYYRFGYNVV